MLQPSRPTPPVGSPPIFSFDDLPDAASGISTVDALNAHLDAWVASPATPAAEDADHARLSNQRSLARDAIRDAWIERRHSLCLAGMELSDLPDVIWEMNHLTALDLAGNALPNMPDGVHLLKQLERLNLARNPIRSLSTTWTPPRSLNWLNLDGNHLPAFPWELVKLAQRGCMILFRQHHLDDATLGRAKLRLQEAGVSQREIFRSGAEILAERFQSHARKIALAAQRAAAPQRAGIVAPARGPFGSPTLSPLSPLNASRFPDMSDTL